MSFSKLIDLELRRYLLGIYNLISPWIVKTRITKLRVGNTTFGYIVRSLFFKVLHLNLPNPVEAQGVIIYHRTTNGRGWWGWCYNFDYEPETCSIIGQIVKPGMTVVDVGAHIGYYSLLSAKLVGSQGKVFAFEPDPMYYSLLEKNIEANKFDAIIEPFRVAVGDKQRQATLFLGKSTGTSLFKIPDITGQTTITDVISLDEFFSNRGWPSVDVIKIDIEGAERIALEGMHSLSRKNQGLKLIIEVNPPFLDIANTSPDDLITALGELGFTRIRILSGEMRIYKIPQDTLYLLNIIQKLSYVNLLCERHS